MSLDLAEIFQGFNGAPILLAISQVLGAGGMSWWLSDGTLA